MIQSFQYARRLLRWLCEAYLVFLTLYFVVMAYALLKCFGATEFSVRFAGFCFQFAGICTVAWGVRETRILFGLPSLYSHLIDWIARRPKMNDSVVHKCEVSSLVLTSAMGRPNVWYPPLAEDTLEQRVEKLERNAKGLDERIELARQNAEIGFRDHALKISAEEQARTSKDNILHTTLVRAETGGLHISLVGLVCLALGAFLSSFPLEISVWFALK